MTHLNKNLSLLLTCCMMAAATAGACSADESEDDGGAGMGGTPSGGSQSGGAAAGGTSTGGTGGTFQGVAGEGLSVKVNGVVVEDGKATVDFTLLDAEGRPVDLYGEKTFGAVDPRFILSYLGETEEGESTQYTAYTTQVQVSEDGKNEEVQSSYDMEGTYETLSVGHYKYTLGAEVRIGSSRAKLTHSLGVFATRTVANVRYVASDIYSWVPDGSEVETFLDVVTDDACNACHTRLEAHGGSRRGVLQCQLCHTETNSIDPDSGNTIDFQVMIHKIHMGANLPSVQAGEPYLIVGYRGSVHDYSEVEYPWSMSDCGKCHQGSQGERWITRPAEKPCSSCHDRTYYGTGDAPEGWTRHTAGPRDDSECIVCHGEDSLEPISKSHRTSLTDAERPVVTARIIGISGTNPGQRPNVRFAIEIDDEPVDLLTTHPDRLRMRIYGPTTDVKTSLSETIESVGDGIAATPCADPVVRPCLENNGSDFTFRSNTFIPDDAEGTFMVGLDGRFEFEEFGRIAFMNPVREFAVTGDEVIPRREIVSLEKCNSCHGDLGPHGDSYKNPLYCLNCHNTTQYGYEEELLPGGTVFATSINFKDLIHSVHGRVGYPAPLNDCEQCHLEGTYLVPLPPELASSTYANVSCPDGATTCDESMGGAGNLPVATTFELPPESAACISCHNASSTVAHAETNTGMSGEACATCHAMGKGQDVSSVHALSP